MQSSGFATPKTMDTVWPHSIAPPLHNSFRMEYYYGMKTKSLDPS